MRRILVMLFALALFLPGGMALAQTETGEVGGSITDTAAKPLELVEVILTGPTFVGQRVEYTTAQGRYRFVALPVGVYTLDITIQGYQPQRFENVGVQVGRVLTVNVRMEPLKAMEEEVVVTARPPLVDTSTATAGVSLGTKQIESVPTAIRSPRELTKYVPSVTGTDVDVSNGGTVGQPSFRGQGGYGNNWMVDGLSVTDPRTMAIGGTFNYDALAEVNIISDAFEPQYGQSLGGIVNIITKKGSNEWDGQVAWLASPSFLTGNSYTAQVEVDDSEGNEAYVNVGGPIIKDHTWFFLSADWNDGSSATPGRDLDYLGVPLGKDIPASEATAKNWTYFGRLDFPINPYHNIYVSGQFQDSTSAGGIGQLPETITDFEIDQKRYRVDYKGVIKKKTVIEAKYGYLKREFSDIPQDTGPAQLYIISTSPTNWRNSFNNSIETRKREDFALEVSHYFDSKKYGTNAMRVGALWGKADIDDNAIWTGGDDIIFDTYPGDYQDPALVGQPNPFQGGSQYQVEFAGVDANGDIIVVPAVYRQIRAQRDKNSFSTLSLYAQNTWTKNKLTLMYGVRADSQEIKNDVGTKVADFSLLEGIAGRFSMQYDFTGDRKNVLKFGVGKFVGLVSTRLGEFMNEQGGLAEQIYSWVGPDLVWSQFQNGDVLPPEIRDPNNWAFNSEQSQESTPSVLDPAIRPNHVNRYMLEYTHVFGEDKLALTGRATVAKARGLLDDIGEFVYMDLNGDGVLDDRNGDGVYSLADTYLNYRTINFDRKRRDYQAFELELNGRPMRKLDLRASIVFTDDKGTDPGNFELGDYTGETGSTNDIGVFGDNPGDDVIARAKERFPNDPSRWTNPLEGLGSPDDDEGWYGKLPYAVDAQFKLLASYQLPREWYVDGFLNWRDGYHWQAKGFQAYYGDYFSFPEGRGKRTTPSSWTLDLGFGKVFKVGNMGGLDLRMDVFNVFNERVPLTYVQADDSTDFGEPYSERQARSARVTLKYEF